MYCIVENEQQFEILKNKKISEVFIFPIEGNFNYHPIFNTVVGVYLRDIYDMKGYFLCINHNDTLGLDIYDVYNYLNSLNNIYVYNFKKFLYFFNLKNPKIVDIHENTNDEISLPNLDIFNFYYSKHYNNLNINSIIPVLKLFEWCEEIFNNCKQHCKNHQKYIYNDISKIFYLIETSGLQLKENYSETLNIKNSKYLIDDSNKIYSSYNLYTQTGRPSNSFNGFNFMAIDKKSGIRENFIPSNDFLVELDFTSYHPILLSKIVDHKFKKTPYEDFAQAFNLTIDQAKNIMFQNIYGGIQDKYKEFSFFKKIDILADKLFAEYKNNSLYCNISGFEFNENNFNGFNKFKVLNYFIQNYETYNNVKLLKNIIKILSSSNTKIIHYTYDAILFDFDKNETNVLENITKYLEEQELKFKIYKGKNYQKMNKVYEY